MKKRDFFWIGAGIGAAVGYWLNTEKGRETRKRIATDLEHKATALNEKSNEAISKATDMITELKDKGNAYLAEMKTVATRTKKDLEQYVDREYSSLKQKLLNEVENSSKS